MRRLVFAFGLVIGCEDDPPPPPPKAPLAMKAPVDPEEAEAKKKAEAEPEKPPRTATEAAHDLLVAGKLSEAVEAAQALEDKDLGSRLVMAAVLAIGQRP